MKLPLTGQQYSEKVTENCVAIWKSLGIYTDCEAKAVEKFLEVFKDQTFPPGASILFALSPNGSLTVPQLLLTFLSTCVYVYYVRCFSNKTITF